jgi:hypothetical protein
MKPDYPTQYSIVEIVYVDGSTAMFTINVGLGIGKYLRDELKDHNSLTLRNDTDVMIITREQLRSFTLRQITKE